MLIVHRLVYYYKVTHRRSESKSKERETIWKFNYSKSPSPQNFLYSQGLKLAGFFFPLSHTLHKLIYNVILFWILWEPAEDVATSSLSISRPI